MLPVKRTTQRLYSTDSKKKSFSDPVSPTPTSNRIVSISPPLPSIESLPGRGTVTRGTRLSPGGNAGLEMIMRLR
ncbi:BnaC05g04170D [Brassica napus]|uniref:BnaC05g04170D protein n=1 Tax=Brassica napus TaxID=3708 RepID=A0A078FAW9_BRANA|nr:BnaC05g04170D [Brassica napus]